MIEKFVIISIDYLGELAAEGKIELKNFAVKDSTIFNEIIIKDKEILNKDPYFKSIYKEYVKKYTVYDNGDTKLEGLDKFRFKTIFRENLNGEYND